MHDNCKLVDLTNQQELASHLLKKGWVVTGIIHHQNKHNIIFKGYKKSSCSAIFEKVDPMNILFSGRKKIKFHCK